jgi:hypothetical protein
MKSIKMKKVILAMIFALPLFCKAQAHLGESLAGLKARYPNKYFKIEYLDDGSKYTTAEHQFGTFVYYFNLETGLTELCLQIPKNMQALSAQIEIYNGNYVVISDKRWKAYLDGGGIINIHLEYDKNFESFIFYYSD